MHSAQNLRAQIEATLAEKIPSALTPPPRIPCPVAPTGIREIDAILCGGLPVGAISEIVGPECSGRTSLAITFVAGMTQAGKVCAWVDVSNTLHPESAAALGVDLSRLLWIRCGVVSAPDTTSLPSSSPRGLSAAKRQSRSPLAKPGLAQAGGGHPRMEAKGLSAAVSDLLGSTLTAPLPAEVLHKPRPQRNPTPRDLSRQPTQFISGGKMVSHKGKCWSRLEQALRVTDLLLQAGGFSCIVLDMGSLDAEYVLRVPLATWFRFRAAADRLQSNVLLLTQHACAKSSAGLVLRLDPGKAPNPYSTIFSGLEHRAEISRQRFPQSPANIFPLRKPPQKVPTAQWESRTPWVGRR
jgi:recombination protein RecA